MSADNAVYIYSVPDWANDYEPNPTDLFRVRHCTSLYPEDLTRDELHAVFADAESFDDVVKARDRALEIQAGLDICEYGICMVSSNDAMRDYRERALRDIGREREHQDNKWGGPEHDDTHHPGDWFQFVAKFLGKAAAASYEPVDEQQFRRHMIKVAALAVAAVESSERREAQLERVRAGV